MCQRKTKISPKPKCTWRFTEKLWAEIFVRWDKRLTVHYLCFACVTSSFPHDYYMYNQQKIYES